MLWNCLLHISLIPSQQIRWQKHYYHSFSVYVLLFPGLKSPKFRFVYLFILLFSYFSLNSVLRILEILMHLAGGKCCWRGSFKRCKWEAYLSICHSIVYQEKWICSPSPQRKNLSNCVRWLNSQWSNIIIQIGIYHQVDTCTLYWQSQKQIDANTNTPAGEVCWFSSCFKSPFAGFAIVKVWPFV